MVSSHNGKCRYADRKCPAIFMIKPINIVIMLYLLILKRIISFKYSDLLFIWHLRSRAGCYPFIIHYSYLFRLNLMIRCVTKPAMSATSILADHVKDSLTPVGITLPRVLVKSTLVQ